MKHSMNVTFVNFEHSQHMNPAKRISILIFLFRFQGRLLWTNVAHINLHFSSCSSPCKKNFEKANVLRRSCKQGKRNINLSETYKEIRVETWLSRLHKCISKSFNFVPVTINVFRHCPLPCNGARLQCMEYLLSVNFRHLVTCKSRNTVNSKTDF